MVEMALTLCVIGILTAMMVQKFGRTMQASRVNRATAILAADLESSFTLSARYRQPMRLSCNCAQASYTVVDRAGIVRLNRSLVDSDFGTLTLTFTAAPTNTLPIEIFPPGISDKSLTARITSGASTRAVTMTTSGQVRIVP
jgi:Tfp pilus assembly protein PilE